jgi:exopolysaccharide production protein ExoZ
MLSLQAGRAVAAMSVLAFHLSIGMGSAGFSAFGQKYTWRGDLGVDFFFVLSGFIIAYAHNSDIGNPRAVGRYLWRRFVRLYPIYWMFTALVVAGLAFLGHDSSPPGGSLGWLTTLSLVRFSPEATSIRPAWTLIHEVGFYLAFALIIMHRKIGWLVFGTWMILCLVDYHYNSELNRTPFRTYLSAINLNFLVGIIAYHLYKKQWQPKVLMVAGLMIFTATFFADDLGRAPSPLLYAIAMGAVIASLAIFENQGVLPVPNWLAHIGNASYVLYLTHEFAVTHILQVVRRVASHVPEGLVFGVTFILTVLIAVALHQGLEKPLLMALKRKTATPVRIAVPS